MPCACHGFHQSRRELLGRAGLGGLALGLGGLAGFGSLSGPAAAQSEAQSADQLAAPGDFAGRMQALFAQAGGPALGEIAPFTLSGVDLPWTRKPLSVKAGQQVSFLLTGRWYLARAADLWFEPGVVFFARREGGAMFNPMLNAGTMTSDRDGRIEIARSAGEWASEAGDLALPPDRYAAADGRIEGVAIAWQGDAREGLRALLAAGDADGLVALALRRAEFPELTPAGWHNHFSFGESGVFRQVGREMACQSFKTVSILRRDVDLDLREGLRLDWDWLVDELPSRHPEDQVATHDYLSIGVEYDDGQDLTYLWSAGLPQGHVFRCPLPGWNAIETHLVQRSGPVGLGSWQRDSRDLFRDYHEIIGGPARKALRVWLLGVSVFQRRMGQCRWRDVSIGWDTPADRVQLI